METTTALTLVIPDPFHNDINNIRKLHDRSYPRWMPHINFLFPFVPEDKFDDIVHRLSLVLESFDSFELELNELGYFKQGKNVTVHLKPKKSDKLKQLFDAITGTLPEIKPKHDVFNPHVTIGQFKSSEVNDKIKELENWIKNKEFKFTVNRICILQRSKEDNSVPFSVKREIMLG